MKTDLNVRKSNLKLPKLGFFSKSCISPFQDHYKTAKTDDLSTKNLIQWPLLTQDPNNQTLKKIYTNQSPDIALQLLVGRAHFMHFKCKKLWIFISYEWHDSLCSLHTWS